MTKIKWLSFFLLKMFILVGTSSANAIPLLVDQYPVDILGPLKIIKESHMLRQVIGDDARIVEIVYIDEGLVLNYSYGAGSSCAGKVEIEGGEVVRVKRDPRCPSGSGMLPGDRGPLFLRDLFYFEKVIEAARRTRLSSSKMGMILGVRALTALKHVVTFRTLNDETGDPRTCKMEVSQLKGFFNPVFWRGHHEIECESKILLNSFF